MATSRGFSLKVLGLLCAVSALAAAPGPDDPSVAVAAMRGDLPAVRLLLDRGAGVNVAQGDGMTALHWAAQRGDLDMVEVLLEAGANPRAGTRIGLYTPLHLASAAGRGAVVKTLLTGGADSRATNTNGTTALHLAAGGASADAVTALLDHGADVDAREFGSGQTPLIFAAAFDRVEATKVLIKAGAGVDITTEVVDLPARAAVDRLAGERRNEVLQALREEARQRDQATWTPSPSQVQAAIQAGREVQESLKSAEEVGKKVNTPYADLVGVQGGLTALHHAVRQGHQATALELVEAGADINKASGDGSSPLHIATMNGHFDLAMSLLERGADANVATHAGATPLFAAINVQWAPVVRYPQPRAQDQQKLTHLELMETLLEAGADPNVRTSKDIWYVQYNYCCAQNVDGATPFWRAAYALDVAAMRLLVKYGADPNIPTRAQEFRWGRNTVGEPLDEDPSGLPPVPVGGPGFFPIHAASGLGYGLDNEGNSHRYVDEGWLPAVKYLLEELGADVTARDYLGYTAVHNAAARGDVELIRYLVEKGADVTAVSRRNQTTADMANSPSTRAPIPVYPEAIELLESLGAKNNHNCATC